jgi:sporulation protein YlmC with PRC-barrel domain
MPTRTLAMRDIADGLLETTDGRHIGRVADIEAEWRPDGSLVVTHLLIGPQALIGRVSSRLRPLARWMLRDRFDHRIPIEEVDELGPTIRLRGPASSYAVGHADTWVSDHILRFIPGNGR